MESKSVLIIGNSVKAVQTALDKANAGNKVTLLESTPHLGSDRYGSESGEWLNTEALLSQWDAALNHENIQVISNADVDIKKDNGSYQVKVTKAAPRVLEDKCNDCKECFKVCPVNMWDDGLEGLR